MNNHDATGHQVLEPIPDTWINASLITCERVYTDGATGVNIIAGTFNRMNHGLLAAGLRSPAGTDTGRMLLHPGWIYGRIQLHAGRVDPVPWQMSLGVLQFGPLVGGRRVPFATGTAIPNAAGNGVIELVIPSLGSGFSVSPDRRAAVADLDAFTVKARYDLLVDGVVVAVHFVDFEYTLIKDSAPHVPLTADSAGPESSADHHLPGSAGGPTGQQ